MQLSHPGVVITPPLKMAARARQSEGSRLCCLTLAADREKKAMKAEVGSEMPFIFAK